jgi:hypothetical protein
MQIKTKLDLPALPTHIVDVRPPQGVKIAFGIVTEKNFGGKGLGTQMYIREKAEDIWFAEGVVLK